MISENEIKQIKNIDLIYIFSTDGIFGSDVTKYIGIKIVCGDKVYSISYDDYNFGLFLKRVIERYNKEKDNRKIILLGDFTRNFMQDSSKYIEKYIDIDLTKNEQIPMFRVINKNYYNYETIIRQMLSIILETTLNDNNVEINKINGVSNHFQIIYTSTSKIDSLFMHIYKIDEDIVGFKLSNDITGTINNNNGIINVEFSDGVIKGSLLYDAINTETEKSVSKIYDKDIIYLDNNSDTLLEEDKEKIKYYFNVLGLEYFDNILKLDDDSYMMVESVNKINETDLLYTNISYLIRLSNPVIIRVKKIEGLTKHNNLVNVELSRETKEYTIKDIKIDNKIYSILEKCTKNNYIINYDYELYDKLDNKLFNKDKLENEVTRIDIINRIKKRSK